MNQSAEDISKLRVSAMPLGDLLLVARDRSPDKEALVFPDQRLTYADLADRAMLCARQLIAAGVRPGDNVGILLPSSVAFVETLFGVAMCGARSILLNVRYRAPEIAYVASNADLVTIVSRAGPNEHENFTGLLERAFPDLVSCGDPLALSCEAAPKLRTVLMLGDETLPGFANLSHIARQLDEVTEADVHRARVGVRIRDTAMILYTSGTSANPKGCLISHEAVSREAAMIANRWRYTPDDRVWSPLPLFHVAAMLGLLAMIDAGGTFIGMPHFDPDASVRMVESEQATSLFLPFVTFLQAMQQAPAFESADFSRVRHVNSCFAVQPETVARAWRAKAPQVQHVGTFGMTEAFGIVSTGGGNMDPDLGFTRLGWPLPGIEVRIADPVSGEACPTGAHGEVLIRGFSVFDGYYKDELRTAEVLDADGWYHSGDIGSVDESGHLMFHGRFKDMLKVGGENVAAAEIEAVLATHPGVKLAQVVGIPDQRLAEVPVAFVELNGESVAQEELVDFVRVRLASFKVPRHVRFISEWPMSATKIQKFQLRRRLMDELGLSEH